MHTASSDNQTNSDENELEQLIQGSISEEELVQRLASEVGQDLKPLSPEKGIDRFLDNKRSDITSNTLDQYESKLDKLLEFCESRDIDDLRDLDGRVLDDYARYVRYEVSDDGDELAPKTMRDEMYLLRNLIEYLERIETVRQGLSEKIKIPDLSKNDGVRNVEVDADRVEEILTHLERFEYATLEHVVWLLAARIARRTSGCVSLDVGDAHLDQDNPYLEFEHRPPETRLKNGEDGNGHVALSDKEAKIIADYIEQNRPDVTDSAGRKPLLATSHGRISKSTFRRYIYKWTRPCMVGNSCPHDRDPKNCEATQSLDHASKCPDSEGPHALRHGYISEALRQGVPIAVLSDRLDVTEEVIREVYNESSQKDRLNLRREVLDEYTSDEGGGYL